MGDYGTAALLPSAAGGADKAKRGGEDTAATAEVFLRASTSPTTSLERGSSPCRGALLRPRASQAALVSAPR